MVSKPGELNVVRERRSMHHLREQPRMGQEFSMLAGKATVVRMLPWNLGVRRFAVQCQEREKAIGASDLETIPNKLGFFPRKCEIHR